MKTAVILCFVAVTVSWSVYAGKVKSPDLNQEPEILGSSEHLKKAGGELETDKGGARSLEEGSSMTGVSSRSVEDYVLKVQFQEELRRLKAELREASQEEVAKVQAELRASKDEATKVQAALTEESKEEAAKMQAELREASQQIRHLTSKLQETNKELQGTNNKFEQAHKEVQILRKNLADSKKKPALTSAGLPHANETFAFSAHASVGGIYEIGEIVVFDQLLYSTGNGYDVGTSSYTCPAHGLYLFSVNVRMDVDPNLVEGDVSLVQNTVRVASLKWAAYHGFKEHNHVSTTVLLECRLGDVLRVEAFEQTDVMTTSNSDDIHYTSFSGILLATL